MLSPKLANFHDVPQIISANLQKTSRALNNLHKGIAPKIFSIEHKNSIFVKADSNAAFLKKTTKFSL